ncbi:helix-turn-helix domain-containing protein [Corynebacterium timonense]|uniref:Helix-turn-helix n=1 Tax=Corynebacterium timonense TaxID=441500 RepID=A0A1H1LSH8_9CORY|nr:helix-turn-helix transcriptional regulator [Corynebacterium timonense]SDR77481.1 hypothetical protein SAMN04488539_0321 [Corynebacterium timonense]
MTTCIKPNCTRTALRGARHRYCYIHAKHHGFTDPHVDAAPTINKVRHLTENGWTLAAIADETGLSTHTIRILRRGSNTKVRTSTAKSIARINPARPTGNTERIPAWPYIRRLHALQAAGWSQQQIAAYIGAKQQTVSRTSTRNPTLITRELANRINTTIWEDQHDAPVIGPPTPTARKNGWAPPAAWDDIDDPDTHPGVTHCIECDQPVHTRGRCKKHHKRLYDQERNRRHAAA